MQNVKCAQLGFLFLYGVILLSMAGCSKAGGELKGEMFIVTKGSQNIKLGAIEVRAIPLKEYRTYISARLANDTQRDLSINYYLDELPKGIATTTTDSEGKFTLTLPEKDKYILAAHAQRQLFDTTERYYWVVPVDFDPSKQPTVQLSNNNLIEPDYPYWRTLLP
jgi:uncharacterized protein YcfL